MKLKIDDVRDGRQTRQVDIQPFTSEKIQEKHPDPIYLTIRTLTVEERDANLGMLTQFTQFDRKDGTGRFTGPDWIHKSRIQLLLAAVVVDDSFPFEKWDEEFVEQLGRQNPALINHLSEEIEALNSPLRNTSDTK